MTKKQKQEYERLKKDVRALSQLPDISPIILEIMKDWIKIREYHFPRAGRFAFSNFRTILPKEYDYMARFVSKLETHFQNDPEFDQALVSQSRSFDRKVFRSIRLAGKRKGHTLAIPYVIFMEERLNPSSGHILREIIYNLNRNPSYRKLPEFIDLLFTCRKAQRVRLSEISTDFLKSLTDLSFATTGHGFPSQQDIIHRLGCTDRTASNIQNFLMYLEVITSRYLVNYTRLGFTGFMIFHKTVLPTAFNPFTLRTYLIERNTYLSIIFLPPNSALVEEFPPGRLSELLRYNFSRNFEQLHYKEGISFKFPVRLSKSSIADITPGDWGINFDLTRRTAVSSYSITDLKLLDQLIVTASSYQDLALSIESSESYLKERFVKLYNEKIMEPFYFIDRIGLTNKILVIFEGTSTETRKIADALLNFPHVELFLTQEVGVAVLKVPSHWSATLYDDIISLREEYDIYGMLYHPILSRWGIRLADQAQKTDFFGLEWEEDETQASV
ncbi:MAG: hypothetical protein ACE5OZ_18905 [Candidatus Heimdallarchaeota archaeon]